MKIIPLTKGYSALVDDKDYKRVSQFKWCAVKKVDGGVYAAHRKHGKMHRFILNLSPRKPEVDHKDHNGLNNQKENLRVATHSQNCANTKKIKGTSKFKGVSWCKSRNLWVAAIGYQGKMITLGRFKSEIQAAKMYNQAAKKLFGDFACLNLI